MTKPALSLILPNKERPVPEISVFALNVEQMSHSVLTISLPQYEEYEGVT